MTPAFNTSGASPAPNHIADLPGSVKIDRHMRRTARCRMAPRVARRQIHG